MNWGKWKIPAIGWASVAIALWALLYGFYWHDRTGHQVFWGDALVNWVGDIVMLGWVERYQNLLGGLSAIAAAAAVYVTYLKQRADVIADRRDSLRTTRIEQIAQLDIAFAQLSTRLMVGQLGTAELSATVGQVLVAITPVAAFAPQLARWSGLVARYIDGQFSVILGKEELDNVEKLKLIRVLGDIAQLASYFLVDGKRFIDDQGNFRWVPTKRAAARSIDPSISPFFQDAFSG